MEHIVGPVFGFYLACYTLETREGHYGYAKLCIDPPDSVWDTGEVLRKVAAGPYSTPEAAVRAVISRSERRLARREARRNSEWLVLDSSPQPLVPARESA
ncbi:MAG: hypothetical protein ACXWC2_18560 [Ramlibacter sp.]